MVNLEKLNLRSHIMLLWAVVATGFSLMLIWHTHDLKQQHEAYMHKGEAIMSNCIANMEVSNKLALNCSAAYNITKECMSDPSRCDLETEKQKLQVLNHEKETLEDRLNELSTETSSLLMQNKKTK